MANPKPDHLGLPLKGDKQLVDVSAMESRRAWLWLAAAALLPAAGCSSAAETVHADGVSVATPTTARSSSLSGDNALPFASDISGDDTYYAHYWTTSFHSVTYFIQSSGDLDELFDGGENEFRVDPAFGMPPGFGRLLVWSPVGDSASHPTRPVVWPSECLGVSPDLDGDGLVDACDPYPADGPLADFDGDGVLNPDDNCPSMSNADQETLFEGRSSGAVCDGKEVHPSIWMVPAIATLDGWNEHRAEIGLDPIVMSERSEDLPAGVARWCEEIAALEQEDVEASGFAYEVPAEYGLSPQEVSRLDELSSQFRFLASRLSDYEDRAQESGEFDVAEYEQIENELHTVQRDFIPFRAVLSDSELACP